MNSYDELPALFDSQPRPRSAWANPAEAHPGEAQTTLYAQQVVRYE